MLSELKSLDFNVTNTSRYICRVCLDKLKKRRGLITQLLNVEDELNIHQLKRPGGNDVPTETLNAKKQRESTAENNDQPPLTSSPVINSKFSEDDRDGMLAYQEALFEYGMLVVNFWDAVAEGDGERILRCWKFFLMYLKHQGGSATKYSLEVLYRMFQVYALLRTADCEDRETPVNDPFGNSLIFCPKIPLGDLILKIIFKDSSEFLFFRNSRKFESAVKVRFFV